MCEGQIERVAFTMPKTNWLRSAIKYWRDENTNIFNNSVDAAFGMFAMVAVPAASLYSVFTCSSVDWANYIFPVTSIAIAGLYDAYGRFSAEKRRVKLGTRITLDVLAIFLAAVLSRTSSKALWLISPALLTLSGVMLIYDAYIRIDTAIRISEWSVSSNLKG